MITLAADASRRAALLVACILPVCALLAPGRAGASTPTLTNLFLTGPLLSPAHVCHDVGLPSRRRITGRQTQVAIEERVVFFAFVECRGGGSLSPCGLRQDVCRWGQVLNCAFCGGQTPKNSQFTT